MHCFLFSAGLSSTMISFFFLGEELNLEQFFKVMFCRVCGFRVRVWESYRTSRSFGYGYGSVTEHTEVPGIVARAYRTHRSSGRVQKIMFPYSWSMAAGLLAFSSRQFALAINHEPLSASHYFSFLSKRSGRRMPPAERSALYTIPYTPAGAGFLRLGAMLLSSSLFSDSLSVEGINKGIKA